MNAREVMQPGVVSVSPELTLRQFEEFLTSEDISGAPVVSRGGQVIGMASKTDIVTALAEELEDRDERLGASRTVEDVMSRDVVTVAPATPVEDVARVMVDGHLHRVLVLEGEAILGIITPLDVLGALVPERSDTPH